MKTYKVRLTTTAHNEQDLLYKYMTSTIYAPLTAERYMSGLEAELNRLSRVAGLLRVDERLSKRYGCEIRRTNYKKYAILYTIKGDKVYIHHIVPQKMIK